MVIDNDERGADIKTSRLWAALTSTKLRMSLPE